MTFVSAALPPGASIAGTANLLARRLAEEAAAEGLFGRCIETAVFAESAALALRDRTDRTDRTDRSALLAAADAFRAVVETLDGHPGIRSPWAQAVLRERAPSKPMAGAETSLAFLTEVLLSALVRFGELQNDLDNVAIALRAGLHAASAHASLLRAGTDAGHLR